MLKLARHVFAWTADPRLADYYERALFNGILGTQDPKTGMTMYHVPLAGGYWKTFATPLDSFWCWTGTGVESPARLGRLSPQERDCHATAPPDPPCRVPQLTSGGKELAARIKPVPGKALAFRVQGQKFDVRLVPFCFLFDQHYAVYWKLVPQASFSHLSHPPGSGLIILKGGTN